MKHVIASILAAMLITPAVSGCTKSNGSSPPPSGPVFAIFDGQSRPTCTLDVTRTDLVSPQTVDTINWGSGAPR